MEAFDSTGALPMEPGADWHLCWQAAVGRQFFADEALYARVRTRLIEAHGQRGRGLIGYLLLPGEIHVVSRLSRADSCSGLARGIGTIVSRWVRDGQRLYSPVFAGAFRAHRLDSLQALRNELRMLAWRPVHLGLCKTPTHYAHTSLRAVMGLAVQQRFEPKLALGVFGEAVPQARQAMRAWLAARPTQWEIHAWELMRGLVVAPAAAGARPMGLAQQHAAALALLVAAGGREGVVGALRLLEAWVLVRLGLHGQVDLHGSSGRDGSRGRALVACLAVDLGLCSAAAVARHFRRSRSTLSEQMRACRLRPADAALLGLPAGRLAEEAVALAPQPR